MDGGTPGLPDVRPGPVSGQGGPGHRRREGDRPGGHRLQRRHGLRARRGAAGDRRAHRGDGARHAMRDRGPRRRGGRGDRGRQRSGRDRGPVRRRHGALRPARHPHQQRRRLGGGARAGAHPVEELPLRLQRSPAHHDHDAAGGAAHARQGDPGDHPEHRHLLHLAAQADPASLPVPHAVHRRAGLEARARARQRLGAGSGRHPRHRPEPGAGRRGPDRFDRLPARRPRARAVGPRRPRGGHPPQDGGDASRPSLPDPGARGPLDPGARLPGAARFGERITRSRRRWPRRSWAAACPTSRGARSF